MSIEDILNRGVSYSEYRNLIDELIQDGKTTGSIQTKERVEFTRINIQRMNRLDKTINISLGTQNMLQAITKPIVWLVVGEAWCGDSAQIIPVMNKIAQASGGKIELKILLRDNNPMVMEEYNAKSIPKLLFIDKETMEVVSSWGARPEPAREIAIKWKNSNGLITWEEFEKELHLWYARDRGITIIKELVGLIFTQKEDYCFSCI